MTYSIIARDTETGCLGIAVASCIPGVGRLVPYLVGLQGAVATQALLNPLWGIAGVQMLSEGRSSASVIAELAMLDALAEHRQAHMVDADGRFAVHTGSECLPWCGHAVGDGVSVAGNLLTGGAVIAETLRAYQAEARRPFAERLLIAMEAGDAAGGDRRGRQSAAIRIHGHKGGDALDIRADDHAVPLVDLRRALSGQ